MQDRPFDHTELVCLDFALCYVAVGFCIKAAYQSRYGHQFYLFPYDQKYR